jgi:hypothetical protein
MKYIELGKGLRAIVDDEDFEELSKDRWYVKYRKDRKHKQYYAFRSVFLNKKNTFMLMHRQIMGVEKGDTRKVDHINHNTLDNRKENLRVVTHQQNQFNRKKEIGCSSKYKGVSWYKRDSNWMACIKINKKTKYLGYFSSEIEAARAYDSKAIELFGEYAHLNFPKEEYASNI